MAMGEKRLQKECVVYRKLLYLMFAMLVAVVVALPQVADARGGGHGGGGHGGGGHGFGGHGFGGHGFGGHGFAIRGFGGGPFFGHRGFPLFGARRFHHVRFHRGFRHGYYPYYHHRGCWRWVHTWHGWRHVNVC